MTPMLGDAGRRVLDALLEERALLAFDYDGTLAPIRRRTIEAWLPKRTQALWGELCRRIPCAVISGRGLADLRRRMKGTGPCTLVGNHGMEPDYAQLDGSRWIRQTKRWVATLRARLRRFPGVVVEGKRYSLSVHWRGVPNPRGLTERVREAARTLEGARMIAGKQVLNVVPAGAPNKGDALLATMRTNHCRHALFVGDDVTDEDAFALGRRHGVIGLRVRPREKSHAPFFLTTQSEVNSLLDYCLRRLPETPSASRRISSRRH